VTWYSFTHTGRNKARKHRQPDCKLIRSKREPVALTDAQAAVRPEPPCSACGGTP